MDTDKAGSFFTLAMLPQDVYRPHLGQTNLTRLRLVRSPISLAASQLRNRSISAPIGADPWVTGDGAVRSIGRPLPQTRAAISSDPLLPRVAIIPASSRTAGIEPGYRPSPLGHASTTFQALAFPLDGVRHRPRCSPLTRLDPGTTSARVWHDDYRYQQENSTCGNG